MVLHSPLSAGWPVQIGLANYAEDGAEAVLLRSRMLANEVCNASPAGRPRLGTVAPHRERPYNLSRRLTRSGLGHSVCLFVCCPVPLVRLRRRLRSQFAPRSTRSYRVRSSTAPSHAINSTASNFASLCRRQR